MVDYNEHIDFLILQYSKGIISPEGTEELLLWVEKNSTHKIYFKEQLAVLRAVNPSPAQFADASGSLAEFQKINKRTHRITSIKRAVAIAASIALIAVLANFFFNQQEDIQTKTVHYTARDSNLTIQLEDKTQITLSKNSELEKPEQFDDNFRTVSLSGKAFFDVTADASRPFTVDCGDINIKVLGTSFEVETDTLANLVRVAVTKGLVSVNHKKSEMQKSVPANVQVVVSQKGKLIRKSEIESSNFLAWKTGILEFDNTSMAEVAEELTRMYGKKIVFNDKYLESEKITTTVDNQPLPAVKMVLEIILNARIEEKEDTLIFYAKQ
ncbi:FecR family protein [Mariniphaga anaerophila]|uniref:FecR family protein n=1 Tax=Mariniphaga anaerophila TaxID=1484053 RepID=A0A1M4SZW4_9BACT|nr:FecR domain-containing protein [Mariniphaga anaerophila]SHE37755.1 FecR family protein [Mariniphaga anaerophila]